ncbi:unnamed protein product [Didymodactylos carnosus]|uniref:Archease domain-containing protein n=1 Tax=Didymodactylos carnosus TaxID=1234261 RepID=A0A814IRH6_9BILA|nr:unnamed protein product [Didymodactylos carnosus]CAF1029523.1 unnamed protein product [Didymodactylos carnosus]CAF3624696.1 unnamed protein product [Didymodactylos carnosus]CAF3800461.1 unnamed protein product [Didymodactylos carnosus]
MSEPRKNEAVKIAQQQHESDDTTKKKNNQVTPVSQQENDEEWGISASNDGVTFDYPEIKYEFLDNTADVQLHAWGDSIEEAFEQIGMAMFGYMTDIERIENKEMKEIDIQAEGDLMNLLYKFLCEWLEVHGTEDYFIARKIEISEFDRQNLRIIARGFGEQFDIKKHTQGTEVKAITYSNMQIHEEKPTNDVYVIVDI